MPVGTSRARVPRTREQPSAEARSMDLKPLGDRLIVEILEEEEVTASGIVLPDTAKEKPQRGKVLAVGKGRYEDGQLIALDVEVGDEIIYSKYGGAGGQGGGGGEPVFPESPPPPEIDKVP